MLQSAKNFAGLLKRHSARLTDNLILCGLAGLALSHMTLLAAVPPLAALATAGAVLVLAHNSVTLALTIASLLAETAPPPQVAVFSGASVPLALMPSATNAFNDRAQDLDPADIRLQRPLRIARPLTFKPQP